MGDGISDRSHQDGDGRVGPFTMYGPDPTKVENKPFSVQELDRIDEIVELERRSIESSDADALDAESDAFAFDESDDLVQKLEIRSPRFVVHVYKAIKKAYIAGKNSRVS